MIDEASSSIHSDAGTGGPGGPLVPHYLANQLTLFQPLADHPPAGGFARPSGVAGNKSALN
jgi:hypothetical protein